MARQSFISNLGGYALKKLRLLVNGNTHEYDTTQPVDVTITSGKQINIISTDNSVNIDEQSTTQSVTFDLSAAPAGVFFATDNITTYQEVLDAYNAGKLILMYKNNLLYTMTSHEPAGSFGFTAFYIKSGYLYTSYNTVTLDSNDAWTVWASGDVMSLHDRQYLVQSGSALEWDSDHAVINLTRLALYKKSIDADGNTTVTVPNGVFINLTGVSTSTLTIRVELESYAYEGQETANFVLEVTPSVNCDITIQSNENHWATPSWVTLKHDASLGNQLTANKTYQIVCRGSCWSFKEYS